MLAFIKRQKVLDSNDSSALELAYNYYLKNEDDLAKIVREIKQDFDPRNVLNANDTSGNMLEKGQYEALNTLDSPNNLYRVVFAVAKLTEGWDVLNLYDIVRIEQEAATNKNATMVEAQLIGRGARYYPFELDGVKSYQRRFDNDTLNKQLFLETLHYHTMNEPQYLKQLVGSLKQMDLPTGQDKKNPPIEIKLKPAFKKTDAYRTGKIYYNEAEDVADDWFDSIQKYGITHKTDIQRSLNYGTREVSYQATVALTETKQIHIDRFDNRYIKKAIQRLEFYQFDNLKKYLPLLESMKEFIYGENWLNASKLKLFLTVPKEYKSTDITADEILKVTIDLLKEYEVKFKSGYVKKRGTSRFVGYPISEYLTNYNKRVPEYDTANLLNEATQKVAVYDMILKVTIDLLKEYEVKFKSGYVKKRGTSRFVGYPISEYLTNYNKRVPEYDTANLLNEATQKVAVYDMDVKKRGTSRFVGYPISEYLTNYNKRVPEYDTANLLNEATQKVAVYDMVEDFYVYDRAIVNKLEFDLITRIQAHVNELKAKYNKAVYLFRMDENMHEDFYVYDRAIVNKLEFDLITRIQAHVNELKAKYNKAVYLFRMDENMHRESAKSEKLKLHQYGSRINRAGETHVNELKAKYNKAVYLFRMDENMHRESAKSEKLKLHQYGSRINRAGETVDMHLQGFQPDFILFLEDSAFYFQIFIEPKGMSGDRFVSELWKQDLLLYMTDHQAEMEFEDGVDNIKISGLKFFTAKDGSGDRFVSELWKQDLLLYMTDHQAEMEFEDGVDNIKISGLKFFTAKDGQNTIPELMAMSGVTYQKPNEQIDLLMVADPSTDVIIEEDE